MFLVFFILYRSLFFIGQNKKMRSKYSSAVYFFKWVVVFAGIERSYLPYMNHIFEPRFFHDFSLSRENSIFILFNSSRDKSDPSSLIPLETKKLICFRIIDDSLDTVPRNNWGIFLEWISYILCSLSNALFNW